MFVDISLSEMLVRKFAKFPNLFDSIENRDSSIKRYKFCYRSLNTGARKAYISRDAKRKREKGENTGLVLINR